MVFCGAYRPTTLVQDLTNLVLGKYSAPKQWPWVFTHGLTYDKLICYFGSTAKFSLGSASYVFSSMFRWAITNSFGVCVSHSETERSIKRGALKISRKRRFSSPVFSM